MPQVHLFQNIQDEIKDIYQLRQGTTQVVQKLESLRKMCVRTVEERQRWWKSTKSARDKIVLLEQELKKVHVRHRKEIEEIRQNQIAIDDAVGESVKVFTDLEDEQTALDASEEEEATTAVKIICDTIGCQTAKGSYKN